MWQAQLGNSVTQPAENTNLQGTAAADRDPSALTQSAHNLLHRAANRVLLIGATLPALPLVANAADVESGRTIFSDWHINGSVVAAGVVAVVGWIAYAARCVNANDALAGKDSEIARLDKTVKADQVRIAGLTTKLDERVQLMRALINQVKTLPEEQKVAFIGQTVPELAVKLESKELAPILDLLPVAVVAKLFNRGAEVSPLDEKLTPAVKLLPPAAQAGIMLELFQLNSIRSMEQTWPVSTYPSGRAIQKDAADKLEQLLQTADPQLMLRASQSAYAEFKMAAVKAADKERHSAVIAALTKDSNQEIRDAAFAKWLDRNTSWPDLMSALTTGGTVTQKAAASWITLEKGQQHFKEVLAQIVKHPNQEIRCALFRTMSAALTAADLETLAPDQYSAEINWKIFQHPQVSAAVAATSVNKAMRRINVVDRAEEGHSEQYDQYSSNWVVDSPEESHNEFHPQETDQVLKVLETWKTPAVAAFFAALTDAELNPWLKSRYDSKVRDRKVAEMSEGLKRGTVDLGEAVAFLSSLPETDVVGLLVAKAEPAAAAKLLRAMDIGKASSITKQLPVEYILKTMQ